MKDYITYLKFDDLSEEELFECFQKDIKDKRKAVIVTPNLDQLRVSFHDSKLRSFLNNADYSTIDGKPLLGLAKKEKKKNFIYKISGSDMIFDFLPIANKKNYSMLIFGGKKGVAEEAKKKIGEKYKNINIVKCICPEFGFEKSKVLSEQYIKEINDAHADINLLCTGFPKTEYFYIQNEPLFLNSLYFFVGATVDFLAGNIKRAPKWISKAGFEWLFRLFNDFHHLFKRYWLDFWFLIKIKFNIIFNEKALWRKRN